MDGENWTESMSRKDRRKMTATAREKERQLKEPIDRTRTDGPMTQTFPRDGEAAPTPQALQALLQGGGRSQ